MQYPVSVAVTWQTSFDQLTEPARKLLHRLAPDPIPESLLSVDFTDGNQQGEAFDSKIDYFDSLVELEKYSLVARSDDQPYFSVHRLVQDVTRRSLQGDAEHPYQAIDSHAIISAKAAGDGFNGVDGRAHSSFSSRSQ
jgi:hypothetical protein